MHFMSVAKKRRELSGVVMQSCLEEGAFTAVKRKVIRN